MNPDSTAKYDPAGSAGDPVRPLDWARASGNEAAVAAAVAGVVRRRRQRRVAALAAACGLAVVAGLIFVTGRSRVGGPAVAASVVVTQPERRTLPDGSTVELRADAALAVEFQAGTSGLRRVVLLRGEAHFAVAKDPSRPFVVDAGGVTVRAVGTEFAVQRGTSGVDVVVTEGRVSLDETKRAAVPVTAAAPELGATPLAPVRSEVVAAGAGEPIEVPRSLVLLDAGRRAVVAVGSSDGTAPQVTTVSAEEMSERLAWRVPWLEFSATPIGEVVEIFNRHAASRGPDSERLVLGEAALASLPLSGVLRADNLPVLLKIMESAYGIRAERRNGEMVLRAAR